jgi:hypothetical protein
MRSFALPLRAVSLFTERSTTVRSTDTAEMFATVSVGSMLACRVQTELLQALQW